MWRGVGLFSHLNSNHTTFFLQLIGKIFQFLRYICKTFSHKPFDGINRTGRIAEGYEADLILVPSDPLADVRALQDVLLVMSNGQIALKRIPFAAPE